MSYVKETVRPDPRPGEMPHPAQGRHLFKADAKKALARKPLHAGTGIRSELGVYRCRCGAFHIGHKLGTTYKKLRKAGLLEEQQNEVSP